MSRADPAREPAARFTNRAADYAGARPSYPPAIAAAVLDGFHHPVVADLGAGTGISSLALAQAGALVFAVEPNARMRAAIAPSASVVPVEGHAEATTLGAGSVDVVTAFQAFHWFDRDAVVREAARIAKPRARFAAVWNHRDRDDAVMHAYDEVIDRYGEENHALDAARRASGVLDVLAANGWRDARVIRMPNVQHVRWERLAAYVRSCSYLPREGEAYDAMMRELRALFERVSRDGSLRFAWETEAYLADRQ